MALAKHGTGAQTPNLKLIEKATKIIEAATADQHQPLPPSAEKC